MRNTLAPLPNTSCLIARPKDWKWGPSSFPSKAEVNAAVWGNMSTRTATYTYTHSVNYVTDQILRSFKDILRDIGLRPDYLVFDWEILEHGMRTWLETRHLQEIHLEILDPSSGELAFRWSFAID